MLLVKINNLRKNSVKFIQLVRKLLIFKKKLYYSHLKFNDWDQLSQQTNLYMNQQVKNWVNMKISKKLVYLGYQR
jgi:hypothetical protein